MPVDTDQGIRRQTSRIAKIAEQTTRQAKKIEKEKMIKEQSEKIIRKAKIDSMKVERARLKVASSYNHGVFTNKLGDKVEKVKRKSRLERLSQLGTAKFEENARPASIIGSQGTDIQNKEREESVMEELKENSQMEKSSFTSDEEGADQDKAIKIPSSKKQTASSKLLSQYSLEPEEKEDKAEKSQLNSSKDQLV